MSEKRVSGAVKESFDSFLGVVRTTPDFGRIRFIILYGSVAEGTNYPDSDIDIAISSDLESLSAEKLRLFILGRVSDLYDVHIFEHLPLYIQIPVLKGIVLYVRDEDELYDIAYRTIQEYGFYKPHLDDYIGEGALE